MAEEAELLHQEAKMAKQAIWQCIAKNTARQLIRGYAQLIQEHMDQGFNAYFLSFMFKPLTGSSKALLSQMNDECAKNIFDIRNQGCTEPKIKS